VSLTNMLCARLIGGGGPGSGPGAGPRSGGESGGGAKLPPAGRGDVIDV
jgi:hypothetical protein